MRLSKEILATLSVVCLTSGIAFASAPTGDVQAYAHPTLFSAQGHSLLTGNTDSVTTGAKVFKPACAKQFQVKKTLLSEEQLNKLSQI